ncbi:MAG: polysaccharide biosynthesis protein [Clostridiales bacterium]|nr:polysaccharide biosynthesis protein [Clostridiales bacterium]
MSNKKKTFLNGALILAIAGLICKVIGAIYKIPLRNFIGEEAMGIYTTVYPIYTFLLIFSTSGIPTAISKLVAQERSKGNHKGAHKVFLTSLKMLILVGGFTSFLMLAGSTLIADVLKVYSWQPVAAIAFSLLFVSLLSAYRGYYQGMQNMMPTAITQLVEQIIKLFAGFFFAIRWIKYGPQISAAGALLGITISELIAFVTIFLMYHKDKKKILTFSDNTDKTQNFAKSLLAIAVPMTIGGAVKPLVDIIDSVMVKTILENTFHYPIEYINALYGFLKNDCGTLINMPSVLTVALSMALVPAISEALTNNDNKTEVKRISATGIKLSFVIGLPCTVGLFTLAKEILSLLYVYVTKDHGGFLFTAQAKLETTGIFMMILALGILFLSIIQTTAGILQGMGKVIIPVVNLGIGMIVKIVMNLVLIPIPALNIFAVPIGTVTCYGIAALLDLIFVIKCTKTKLNFTEILRPLGASVLMACSIYLMKYILNAPLILGGSISKIITAFIILIAAVVYFIGICIFSVFDESDLKFMPGGKKIEKVLKKVGVKIRPSVQ